MPRKTQLSQKSIASTSRKRQHNETLDETFTRSQVENIDELVNNCVRFVIYRAGNKLPIRKLDLQKNVIQNAGRSFDKIMQKVTKILEEVYGYDLYVSEETAGTKQYLVTNILSYIPGVEDVTTNNADDEEEEEDTNPLPNDINKILIMLVLTHIFMSNSNVNEASLFSFLRSIKIDPEESHQVFGNVKDFITTKMVKQRYLNTEVDPVTRRVTYLWGPRAEHEISKHALLQFVCKMYKDRNPRSWTSQLEAANAQNNQMETHTDEEGGSN